MSAINPAEVPALLIVYVYGVIDCTMDRAGLGPMGWTFSFSRGSDTKCICRTWMCSNTLSDPVNTLFLRRSANILMALEYKSITPSEPHVTLSSSSPKRIRGNTW